MSFRQVMPLGKHHAYLMVFLHEASRKVWVSPATYYPDAQWVNQQGRNALMWLEDLLLEESNLGVPLGGQGLDQEVQERAELVGHGD